MRRAVYVLCIAVLWAPGAWSDKKPRAVAATRTQAIVARDGVAFVGQGGGLVLRDVTDPTRPRDLGWLSLPTTVLDVALDGDHAFLAAGTRGLVIADISDPSEPREVARLDTDGKAKRVVRAGKYAYLADGVNGLLVIDVSTLDDPRVVARISTSGDVRAVAVSGESLAIAEAHGGARVFSLRRGDNPRESRHLDTEFAARDVCWIGDRLFVAAGGDGIAVYEPKTSSRPKRFLEGIRSAQHVACSDPLLAVSNLGSALQLFAAGEDGAMGEVSRKRVHRTSPIGRASFDGSRLWIAADIAGMGLFDLTDPGAPEHILPRQRDFNLKF